MARLEPPEEPLVVVKARLSIDKELEQVTHLEKLN